MLGLAGNMFKLIEKYTYARGLITPYALNFIPGAWLNLYSYQKEQPQ